MLWPDIVLRMTSSTRHRRGIFLSFCCGAVLLPLLLLWGAGWVWSAAVALTAATTLAALRHWRPSLFDGEIGGNVNPRDVASQEEARARAMGRAHESLC